MSDTFAVPASFAWDVKARTKAANEIISKYSQRGEHDCGINAVAYLWAQKILEIVARKQDDGSYRYYVYRIDYPQKDGGAIVVHGSVGYATQQEAMINWSAQAGVLCDMDDMMRAMAA